MSKKTLGASGNIKVYQDDSTNYIIDIDPTFKGQVSINTVGTIIVGDWQANIIDPEFGGTGINNKGSSLQLNGNTVIKCPLVINCDDGNQEINLHVSKSGSIAIKEYSLQIDNMLSEFKDEGIANLAYDNISPNQEIGDITYHDGLYNKALTIGEEDTYLSVENKIPKWKRHPKYLRYIKKNSNTFENDTLTFNGAGLQVKTKDNATNISLHPTIDSITKIEKRGILTLNPKLDVIEACYLEAGEGINIEDGNGHTNSAWMDGKIEQSSNPVISISAHYPGQSSIGTLGIVQYGKWEAETIAPEFGGTGAKNDHIIVIGGDIETNCPLHIISDDKKEIGVQFYSPKGSILELPNTGKVATEQQSLQTRHNLLDIDCPGEAFRHISPTEKKGDLIVHGPGDYDTRLPVGKFGEVLSANPENNLGVEWVNLNLEEKIENIVEQILKRHLDDENNPDNKNKIKNEIEHNNQNGFVNAIMIQLDHMARTNQIKLVGEMKSALQEWYKNLI